MFFHVFYHMTVNDKKLLFIVIAIAATAIAEWLINKYRPLTIFGSRLIVLLIGYPILAFVMPIKDCFFLAVGYFIYIVWNSEEDQKDMKPDALDGTNKKKDA